MNNDINDINNIGENELPIVAIHDEPEDEDNTPDTQQAGYAIETARKQVNLKAPEDTEQTAKERTSRAVKLLSTLVCIMLAFTIISRVTDSMLIPKVSTAPAVGGSLSWTIKGSGVIDTASKYYQPVIVGMRVTELCARPGDSVASGSDLICRFDIDDVERRLREESIVRLQKEIEYSDAKKMYSHNKKQYTAYCEPILMALEDSTERVAILEAMLSNGGGMSAQKTGTVADIDLKVGDVTTGKEMVTIGEGGTKYVGEIATEDAQKLNKGDTITLIDAAEGKKISVEITDIRKLPDGINSSITAETSDKAVTVGQRMSFETTARSGAFDIIVPTSALRTQPDGSYCVLVMSESSTVLGKEQVAKAATVKILCKGQGYAAVEGMLDRDEMVIVSSEREIKDGDRVRVYG